MKQARVYFRNRKTGVLTEDAGGYAFVYDAEYLSDNDARPISLTLPLRGEPYRSNVMIAFFDGLIPEGWLLDIASHNWKIDSRDRMSLLMTCCKDCIGAVSIQPLNDGEDL